MTDPNSQQIEISDIREATPLLRVVPSHPPMLRTIAWYDPEVDFGVVETEHVVMEPWNWKHSLLAEPATETQCLVFDVTYQEDFRFLEIWWLMALAERRESLKVPEDALETQVSIFMTKDEGVYEKIRYFLDKTSTTLYIELLESTITKHLKIGNNIILGVTGNNIIASVWITDLIHLDNDRTITREWGNSFKPEDINCGFLVVYKNRSEKNPGRYKGIERIAGSTHVSCREYDELEERILDRWLIKPHVLNRRSLIPLKEDAVELLNMLRQYEDKYEIIYCKAVGEDSEPVQISDPTLTFLGYDVMKDGPPYQSVFAWFIEDPIFADLTRHLNEYGLVSVYKAAADFLITFHSSVAHKAFCRPDENKCSIYEVYAVTDVH